MEEKEGEEGGGRKGRRGRKQPQPHSQLGQHIGYLHSHSFQQDNQLFCTVSYDKGFAVIDVVFTTGP